MSNSLIFLFTNITFINYLNFILLNDFFFFLKKINIFHFFNVLTPLFFLENLLLQFFIFYLVFLLFINNNLYYILLYIFFEIVFFGIFICLFQLELFTGFLWVAEFTIIFIAVILLFYLNIDGLNVNYNNYLNTFVFIVPSLFIFLIFFNFDAYSELELYLPLELNFIDFYDNIYESLNNNVLNDFTALTLSYYVINSAEFIVVGLLLLIGSILCICLYKSNKNFSIVKQSSVLSMFDFFKDFINFSFIRKQDLNKQTAIIPSLRYIKKN